MKAGKVLKLLCTSVLAAFLLCGCQNGGSSEADKSTKPEVSQAVAEESKTEQSRTEASEPASDGTKETEEKEITLGISIFTRTHVFYNRVEEAMQKKCDELGVKLAGEYIAKALPEGGEVAIITYDDVENCVLRAEGCKEYLKANTDNIEVVGEQNYQGDAEKASAITQDFLLKYPDLDLIFAVGDPAAMSAYTIVNGAGKDIRIIGYDGNPEAVNEIAKGGNWIANVAQNPEGIGAAMIESAVKAIHGEEIPKEKYIEPYIIDGANAAEYQ